MCLSARAEGGEPRGQVSEDGPGEVTVSSNLVGRAGSTRTARAQALPASGALLAMSARLPSGLQAGFALAPTSSHTVSFAWTSLLARVGDGDQPSP